MAAQAVKVVSVADLNRALVSSQAALDRRVGSVAVYRTPAGTWLKVEPLSPGQVRVTMTKGKCDC